MQTNIPVHSGLPPVLLLAMTARGAGAAVCVRGEIHGHGPVAESNVVLDVLRISCISVHFMAGPAGPSFYDLIDMHVVKIPVAVPETGRFQREPLSKRRLVMAGYAECVFPVGIGGVKIGRIVPGKDPPVVRTVRVVAGNTVSGPDRAMVFLVRLQIRFHIHDLASFRVKLLVMTTQAKFHLAFYEEPRKVGKVRVVTVQASLGIVHGAMLRNGALRKGRLARMTV